MKLFVPHGSTGRKMVGIILLVSLVITLLTTAIQLWGDYRNTIRNIEQDFQFIGSSALDSLKESIWVNDSIQVNLQLSGLLRLPYMEHLVIRVGDQVLWKVGERRSDEVKATSFLLEYNYRGNRVELGQLEVTAGLDQLNERLLAKGLEILWTNAIEIFFVAGLLLVLLHLMVSRPLEKISGYLESLDLDRNDLPPLDKVSIFHRDTRDEFNRVTTVINTMTVKLSVSHQELERKVKERTAKLSYEIEERKQAQKTLEQFKTTLDMTMDCVFMFDPVTLKFFYLNQGAVDQVGYSFDELLNMTPLDIKPEFTEERFRAMAEEIINSPDRRLNFVTLHQHKDGHLIPVEIFLQYIEIEGEEPRFIAIVRDITERKKIEEVLREKEAAEAANRAKSMFLANMSHELRTPMHAILSFTHLAEKNVKDDKVLHYLENIHTSGVRLTGILNDLLDLSKLESGKMDIEPNLFDLAEVANESITSLKSLIDAKNIKLDTTKLVPVSGTFDKKLIIQVITNIMSNAIKFTPEDGNIFIKTTSHEDSNGQYIQLSVTDDGVGIPDNELDTIFDAFVQSSKTKTNAGGTGLGLPISKEIIELHHGKIWAESPVNGSNKGSVFYISIPKDYFHHEVHEINNYIQSHKDWKMMIEMLMNSEDKIDEIPIGTVENHHLCQLGKWLDSNEPEAVFNHEDLEQLKESHKLFHSLAARLIESYKESDFENSDNDLKQFNHTSIAIIKMLKKYK